MSTGLGTDWGTKAPDRGGLMEAVVRRVEGDLVWAYNPLVSRALEVGPMIAGGLGIGDVVLLGRSRSGDWYVVAPMPPPGARYVGEWTWSTGTPAAGEVTLDGAASWAAATYVDLSETTATGTDVSEIVGASEAGQRLRVQQQDDASRYAVYDTTGPGVDMGTYRRLPVTLVESGGMPGPAARPIMIVTLGTATGGGGGAPGPPGPAGTPGEVWYTGSGAPGTVSGAIVGDWYLDSASGNYYDLTTAPATWTLRGNLRGPTGATGSAGTPGTPGTPGEKWFTGSGAPSGATGIVGDWYLDSASGDYYEKTGASAWTLRGNLRGPTGSTGPTGQAEAWWSGSGAPAGATGAVGDWYLDLASGDVYEKTGASTWTLRGNIKGPTGATGPAGTRPIVTTLPASPAVGDEVLYRVGSGASAFLWGFRYTAQDATYPWEFTGGSPLVATTSIAESTTSGTHTTYQNLADGAVAVTNPLAGVYEMAFGAYAIGNGGTNNAYLSVKYSASEASDAEGILVGVTTTAYSVLWYEPQPITVALAAQAVTLRFRGTSNTQITFGRRRLRITPRRVKA